jgi:hypothetical protein
MGSLPQKHEGDAKGTQKGKGDGEMRGMMGMHDTIRRARQEDVSAMAALSERKREQYEGFQPRFWRRAADAREKQCAFFAQLIERENVIALVAEQSRGIAGFVIAAVVAAPPVYDPGGLTCLVDDFALAAEEDWPTVGAALLAEATRQAKVRGTVQTVVVCGHRDEPKRQMLFADRYSIASEWFVNELE